MNICRLFCIKFFFILIVIIIFQLFPLNSPEAVTVVSVWKRYSDVQQLHKSMKSLHAGLHLRGTFPALAKSSYFKRFHQEVNCLINNNNCKHRICYKII